jgi:hypothetical protein
MFLCPLTVILVGSLRRDFMAVVMVRRLVIWSLSCGWFVEFGFVELVLWVSERVLYNYRRELIREIDKVLFCYLSAESR